MDLITRARWGARAWREPNGAIRYAGPRRGVKVHYLGSPYTSRAHSQCPAFLRSVQSQHMDGNGWSDIGYSFAVCQHGSVYEGRGLTRRNSANGTTALNEAHYAVLGLHGTNGTPSDALLNGLRDAIDYCRSAGPAGSEVLGHRDGHPTACPGDALYAWVQQGAPRPGGTTPEDPMPEHVLYDAHGYVRDIPPDQWTWLNWSRRWDPAARTWIARAPEPSWLFGPLTFQAHGAVRLRGLERGDEVQLRLMRFRRSTDDSGWERDAQYPIDSPVHVGGGAHFTCSWAGRLVDTRRERLRLEVLHFRDAPVTADFARVEALTWNT